MITGILIGVASTLFLAFIIINYMDREEEKLDWKMEKPYEWWVDDLTHRVCAPLHHPIVGIKDMPWPDNEKVYIAIDKEYHNQAMGWWYAQACTMMDKGEDIRQVGLPYLLSEMKKDLIDG